MKEQDLLKAMGEIREDYILEAEPVERNDGKKIIAWRRYGRSFGVLAAGLVLVVGAGIYQKISQNMKTAENNQLFEAEETAPKEFYSVSDEVAQAGKPDMIQNASAEEEDAAFMAEDMLEEAEEDKGTWEEHEADHAVKSEYAEAAEEADGAEMGELPEEITLENANMVNPWISCGSLEEGEKIAGFSLTVPEADEAFPDQKIFAVADTLIEVRYLDADGKEGYRIRKGISTESVDGDYNRYDTEYAVEIDEREVTLKGNGTEIAVARWTEKEYSYAVMAGAADFSEEEMTEHIREVR